MKRNYRLTYVMSGCGFTRLPLGNVVANDPVLRDEIAEIFTHIRNPEHDFALLFNAFVEKTFANTLSLFKEDVAFIETDSGGLQIITRGMEIDEKLKKSIYEVQAKGSDYAMSFDEIPVQTVVGGSNRNDINNRWFDKEAFHDKAIQSSINLRDQIDTFLELKSETKPIAIIHGNDYDTFMKWSELLLSQLPEDYYDYIGGVAMGGAALGTGSLENIKRSFFFSQLPEDIKRANHLHLLGIGAIQRILPSVVFLKNGLFDEIHLSYDSTTHSSGHIYGRYYTKEGFIKFPVYFDEKIFSFLYQDIKANMPLLDVKMSEFFEILTNPANNFTEKEQFIKTLVSFALSGIKNFISNIEGCIRSDYIFNKTAHKSGDLQVLNSLSSVKTLEDFNKWEAQVGHRIKSNSIQTHKTNTLDDLFA